MLKTLKKVNIQLFSYNISKQNFRWGRTSKRFDGLNVFKDVLHI
jgi:hypothetical protein